MVASTVTSTTRTGGRSLSYSGGASQRVHRYHWPAIQLNVWMLVLLGSSLCLVGIFATFVTVQRTMLLAVPWYFSYIMTVSCLTVLYIGGLLYLIAQRRLLPSIVILGSFMFFVLWLVGLVVIGMELFSAQGGLTGVCDLLVFSEAPKGPNVATLAWLQQKAICQSWKAAFAFGLIGCVFLLWIIIMAIQVFYDDI